MSRYLEEAAAVLRRVDRANTYGQHNVAMDVAKGFATLAAIDKGLLPADITSDVLRSITDRHAA